MILLDKDSKNKILAFIPLIQDNYAFWHIVSIHFEAKDRNEAEKLVQNFIDANKDTEGFCYLESEKKAISVMNLGAIDNYSGVKSNIENSIEGKRCKVIGKKMSPNGLKQIQINLSTNAAPQEGDALFKQRENRDENVILIIDDDMFIRKSLSSLLGDRAEIHEVSNGAEAVNAYMKYNPDVVILDIHMPEINGLDLVSELNKKDYSAFVLVSSSDSVKENVLEAMNRGAIGFLAKPVKKDRMFEYLDRCVTYRGED
jgi:two-component system chemotaxis response regulator CheY